MSLKTPSYVQAPDSILKEGIISRTPPKMKPRSSGVDTLLNALKPFSESDSEDSEDYTRTDDGNPLEALYSILQISVDQRIELDNLTTATFQDPKEWIPLSEEENDGVGIKAASVNQLIICLTSPAFSNIIFQKKFLLSSPSFVQPSFLLAALFTRYYMDITLSTSNVKTESELNTMRIRIVNILSSWITSLPYQFTQNMLEAFTTFIDVLSKDRKQEKLYKILDSAYKNFCGIKQKKHYTVKSEIPPSILPKGPKETWTLEMIDSEELARQITLYHSKIFMDIGPMEMLTSIWGAIKGGGSKNIELLQQHFDLLSRYVSRDIISKDMPKERGDRYRYWFEVGSYFNDQKNYNGVFSVICGLTHACVKRQTQTLKFAHKIIGKRQSKLDELIALCQIGGDFKNYRPVISKTAGRCVPFIGCFQRDLVYIQESFPNKIGDLINFKKCVACVNLIESIGKFQNERYEFYEDSTIQHLIQSLPPILETKELMELSRKTEPDPK